MKYLKALAVFALVLGFAVPAFAETQNVKVSGSIDAYWFYRDNYDLRDNNEIGVYPAGGSPTTGSINQKSEADGFFMSITQIQVAADLTNNVTTVVNLINQRDWNADIIENSDTNGAAANTGNNEFDITLDLAYVQLKEIFYAPLTLTIGRQDLVFGRGFIIGWNPQDTEGTIQADEFTANQSFDAIRATLDFNPWTVDLVYSKLVENHTNPEDDKDLFIANVGYKFADYNGVAEGYYVGEYDRGTLSSTAALGTFDNTTHTIGGRLQFDPISQITLGAELAYQMGDYRGTVTAPTRDREAWAWDIFGTYRFDNAWKPEVTLEYVHLSGEADLSSGATGSYAAWNAAYRGPTYGRIHEYLETYYGTILSYDQSAGQNLDFISLTGSIKPMEDLSLSLTWYYFWAPEDAHVVTANPNSSVANEQIGNEFDTTITYAYTEDVSFVAMVDFFIPGDFYASPSDETASQYVTGVKVAF